MTTLDKTNGQKLRKPSPNCSIEKCGNCGYLYHSDDELLDRVSFGDGVFLAGVIMFIIFSLLI